MTKQITTEARELVLFAVNDSAMYEQALVILKNHAKKLKAGKYDADKALSSWKALADVAAKKYAKDFDSAANWNRLFSVEDRKQAALEFLSYYQEDLEEMAAA
jgi:dTDP-4-amino-4,6-dideoxygalactose transaminase